jgi:hypothetical protein
MPRVPRAIRTWGWILRLVACALVLAMMIVAVLAACSGDGTASSEVPGGTYGAEISLSIVGRGRVTTAPAANDSPGSCFARILLPGANVDGGDGGITLIAEGTSSAHFVGWSFAESDLGVRARGPSQCSPMTRKASVPATAEPSSVITVPFGETKGTPPRGHEEECAPFTSVSLAYAVTATFEEDPPLPGFDAAPPDEADLDVLFLPKSPGSQAMEIGVTNGYAYWRYEVNGLSRVAGSYLPSASVDEIVTPNGEIRLFDVDRHAVFQYTNDSLWVIQGGTLSAAFLGGAPRCLALASDALNVYCRAELDGGSAIYAWPVAGADASAPSIASLLPLGNDLGVDTQRFYFSEDHGALPKQAKILSAPRGSGSNAEGGVPPSFTTLALGQTSPFGMVVGSSFLAWIDDQGGSFSSSSSSKLMISTPSTALGGAAFRFVAADAFSNEYWLGIGNDGSGAWSIYRITVGMPTATFFRGGTTDLGGLAVDSTYVYWTRPNGRVYRGLKNDTQGGP